MLTYDTPALRQTGSRNHIWTFFVTFFSATIDGRNLIFGHKLHICTPYCGKRFWTHQIPTSCFLTLLIFLHIEHTFCRQTGSRNLMHPKTLPTIWGTYMKLVTKYQISAINSCWEKSDVLVLLWAQLTENRIFTLCRMITWVVFLRMFWNFISSLPVKRGGSLSFLVGTISNVLVMGIGLTVVGSGCSKYQYFTTRSVHHNYLLPVTFI
jgi:hypothetical protein